MIRRDNHTSWLNIDVLPAHGANIQENMEGIKSPSFWMLSVSPASAFIGPLWRGSMSKCQFFILPMSKCQKFKIPVSKFQIQCQNVKFSKSQCQNVKILKSQCQNFKSNVRMSKFHMANVKCQNLVYRGPILLVRE